MENRLPHRGTRQHKRQNEVTLEMLVVAGNPVVGMPSPHGSVDGNTIAQESAMIGSFNAGEQADQDATPEKEKTGILRLYPAREDCLPFLGWSWLGFCGRWLLTT